MKCHGCMNVLCDGKFLKCNNCASEYCHECLGLSIDSFKALSREQAAALICPYCRNVTRRKKDDNTQCRERRKYSLNESMNISFNLPGEMHSSIVDAKKTSAGTDLKNVPVTMESISKLFDTKLAPDSEIMTNLRSALKKDMEKMVAAEVSQAIERVMGDFTATTDFISAEQQDIRAQIADRNATIKSLESELSASRHAILKLEARISGVEKISRSLNIEIHEVPETKNEDLMVLFRKLCESLQVIVADGDIRACRRIAKMDSTSKRPRNILVSLSSQRVRDLILSSVTRFNKAHSNDRLATTHIGFTGESRRIYLSEHLSPETKELHSAARIFCKNKKFKFVWARFGQIYIRKDEQSPAINVKNLDTLDKYQ